MITEIILNILNMLCGIGLISTEFQKLDITCPVDRILNTYSDCMCIKHNLSLKVRFI